VAICIDFIAEDRPACADPDADLEAIRLWAVPSLTPTVTDSRERARQQAKRRKKPAAYANAEHAGHSGIFVDLREDEEWISMRPLGLHVFCSVKGGVGKSTLAVVTGKLLASLGRVPVVVDLDMLGASLADGRDLGIEQLLVAVPILSSSLGQVFVSGDVAVKDGDRDALFETLRREAGE